MEKRAAITALEQAPTFLWPELADRTNLRDLLPRPAGFEHGLSIPGINYINEFTTYLFDDDMQAKIIARFVGVVGPLRDSGAEVDVISHSRGTIIPYKALREPEKTGPADIRNFFTVRAASAISQIKTRLRPPDRDGRKPLTVKRWINLNAHGDPVGGRMPALPYQVDAEYLDLPNIGCGFLDLSYAHGSYFKADNERVNLDILAYFID